MQLSVYISNTDNCEYLDIFSVKFSQRCVGREGALEIYFKLNDFTFSLYFSADF